MSIPTYKLFQTMQYCSKNAYGNSGIQFKERIIIKRGIEEMFSADYFDFYSNFWNTGKTIGLDREGPLCFIKKEKNWMYTYDKY